MAKSIVHRPSVLIVYAATVVTATIFYFSEYPVPGFLRHVGALARAVFFLFLLGSVGRFFRERISGESTSPLLDRLILDVGLGAVPVVGGLLFLGLAGFFRAPVLVGGAILLQFLVWPQGRSLLNDVRSVWNEWNRGGLAGFWAAGLIGFAFLLALAPPTYYDSLVYHLALPAHYLREGRIAFVAYNHYSHFPQNMELIFGWFLAAGSDVGAQVLNVLLLGMTGVLVTRFPISDEPKGFRWDLLIFLTAPCSLLLSSETYVEVPLAFWTTLTLFTAKRAFDSDSRWTWVLVGALAGFAAGIKYTAILTPVILSGLLLLWPRVRSGRDRFWDAAVVAGVSFLVFLPWMIKNAIFTGGNPVFPFFPSVFPANNVHLFKEASAAYFQVLDEYRGSSKIWMDLISFPLRLITKTTTFGGGFDVTGDLGWVLPLMLLPMVFRVTRLRTSSGFLLAYAGIHLILWASLRPVLRFLFPLFPLLCVLAGRGLSDVWKGAGRGLRMALGALVALFLMSNMVLFYWVERVRDPFPVVLGLTSRDEYLSKKLNYYPWTRWMDTLPLDAHVLFVGDQRGYYTPRRSTVPMALLPPPLSDWAAGAPDGHALARVLRQQGFTHLFFHRTEAERIKSYRVLDLTPEGLRAFEDLLRRAPAVHADEKAGLYSLELL